MRSPLEHHRLRWKLGPGIPVNTPPPPPTHLYLHLHQPWPRRPHPSGPGPPPRQLEPASFFVSMGPGHDGEWTRPEPGHCRKREVKAARDRIDRPTGSQIESQSAALLASVASESASQSRARHEAATTPTSCARVAPARAWSLGDPGHFGRQFFGRARAKRGSHVRRRPPGHGPDSE
jgi:hypothetical protein